VLGVWCARRRTRSHGAPCAAADACAATDSARPQHSAGRRVEDEPEVSGWPYPERGDRRDPEEVLTELLRAAMRGGSPITASIPSIGRNVAAGMGCVSRVVFFLMMLAAAFFFGLLGFSPPTGFP